MYKEKVKVNCNLYFILSNKKKLILVIYRTKRLTLYHVTNVIYPLRLAERELNETEVFDEKTFEVILASAIRIRGEIHESATSNIRKAQDRQKRTFIDAIFPTAKLKWEILSYYVTTEEKTEREESFHSHGLVPISFPKLHAEELQHLKNKTVRL